MYDHHFIPNLHNLSSVVLSIVSGAVCHSCTSCSITTKSPIKWVSAVAVKLLDNILLLPRCMSTKGTLLICLLDDYINVFKITNLLSHINFTYMWLILVILWSFFWLIYQRKMLSSLELHKPLHTHSSEKRYVHRDKSVVPDHLWEHVIERNI